MSKCLHQHGPCVLPQDRGSLCRSDKSGSVTSPSPAVPVLPHPVLCCRMWCPGVQAETREVFLTPVSVSLILDRIPLGIVQSGLTLQAPLLPYPPKSYGRHARPHPVPYFQNMCRVIHLLSLPQPLLGHCVLPPGLSWWLLTGLSISVSAFSCHCQHLRGWHS